jgi:hypothetical protein
VYRHHYASHSKIEEIIILQEVIHQVTLPLQEIILRLQEITLHLNRQVALHLHQEEILHQTETADGPTLTVAHLQEMMVETDGEVKREVARIIIKLVSVCGDTDRGLGNLLTSLTMVCVFTDHFYFKKLRLLGAQ